MLHKLQPLRHHPQLNTKQLASLAGVSVLLGAGIFTIAYAGMSGWGWLASLNDVTLDWLVERRLSWLTTVMSFMATVMQPAFVILAGMAFCLAWAWRGQEIWRPLLLFGSLGLAATSVLAIKLLTNNDRPDLSLQLPPFESSFSFPSAHTIAVAALCLGILYLIYSRRRHKKHLWLWAGLAVLLIGLMSFNRLYLAAHWLTDIVGAVGLSLLVLAVVVVLDLTYSRLIKPSS